MKWINILKTAGAIFLLNAIENILLLLFFSVPITKQTLIGVGVFTFALTLLLKLINVIKE